MSLKSFLSEVYENEKSLICFDGSRKEDHMLWKEKAHEILSSLLKLEKLDKYMTNSIPNIISAEKLDDFERIKCELCTFNDVYMPYYILKPYNSNGKAALALHGHGSNGKNTLAGIVKEEFAEKYKKFSYIYAEDFAHMGYTVYIPDLCASGDRCEIKGRNKDCQCNEVNFTANAVGLNLAGIITSELKRLTDVILSDGFDDLTVCGFSGGGLFSLILAAIDERYKCVAASGYFHSYKSTLFTNNFCGCNFIPDLWNKMDCVDFASMIAPRTLIIEVGKEDSLNSDSDKCAKYIESIYDMYDAHFFYNVCEGGHKYYGSFYDILKDLNLI